MAEQTVKSTSGQQPYIGNDHGNIPLGFTIDIMADEGLRELHQTSAGFYGGYEEEIISFFKQLVGASVLMKLKDENPGDLMNDIEMKKCTYSPKMDKNVTILYICSIKVLLVY
uniref:Uncharacterized protein n=1 Tax=Magallana gigas TaxID=29159 RepID=K1QKU1_MAGGI